MPVTGSETLVLGPRDVVWSVIVTSEVPEVRPTSPPKITRSFTRPTPRRPRHDGSGSTTTTTAPPAG